MPPEGGDAVYATVASDTVIETVAGTDVPPAFVAVYVNESGPEYDALGV